MILGIITKRIFSYSFKNLPYSSGNLRAMFLLVKQINIYLKEVMSESTCKKGDRK